MDYKLCINCQHHRQDQTNFRHYCQRPDRPVNLVTGAQPHLECGFERILTDGRSCGPTGFHYQQKEGGLDNPAQPV